MSFPLNTVIFYSYVSLPEDTIYLCEAVNQSCSKFLIKLRLKEGSCPGFGISNLGTGMDRMVFYPWIVDLQFLTLIAWGQNPRLSRQLPVFVISNKLIVCCKILNHEPSCFFSLHFCCSDTIRVTTKNLRTIRLQPKLEIVQQKINLGILRQETEYYIRWSNGRRQKVPEQ